jgi:hypothetical protein
MSTLTYIRTVASQYCPLCAVLQDERSDGKGQREGAGGEDMNGDKRESNVTEKRFVVL